ncbi:MAG: hypothetical protein H6739_04925 [Alphaproteobacteria bacterium]|nr:hypothetical protein [Alphaproteobacteria bacterium]
MSARILAVALFIGITEAAIAGPVIEALPNGHVDWTEGILVVEASGSSNTGAWQDVKAVEQAAFAQLEPRVEDAARQVRFSADTLAGDLLASSGPVARSLEDGLTGWRVTETRYYASGRVELRAELPLHAWLRPALVSQAAGQPDDDAPEPQITGVVVDARGLGVRPALAPQLLGPDHSALYGVADLSEEVAVSVAPVLWITDPSDALATARAGAEPVFLRATAVVGGSDLVLGRDDAIRLRTLRASSALLSTAPVVVVVDP